MIFRFFIISTFFTLISCLLNCAGGPKCQMKLNFKEIVPTNKQILERCSLHQTSSCSVYLRVDYKNRQVLISFQEPSNDTRSPHPSLDLLENNRNASIILRYTVKIKIEDKNKYQLYIFLQCRTTDRCTEKQLRHFWPRFLSADARRNSFRSFRKLLLPTTSNTLHCYDDLTNQTRQCSPHGNTCWAETNTQRRCTNHSIEFLYSYNKVDRPHRLASEDVYYTLACRITNCTNNDTIYMLSAIARQFAETEWSTSRQKINTNHSSFAAKHVGCYFHTFSFTLLILLKNTFF